MRAKKTMLGAGISHAKRVDKDLRPYNMRISREHGGGLWTVEDDTGQLYLAVLSREVSAVRRVNKANGIRRGISESEAVDEGRRRYDALRRKSA